MTKVTDFKYYQGDVNLEYGGFFANLDNWRWDYVDVLRVTDLDSGCGFTGAVMVERLTVLVPDNDDKLNKALSLYGMTKEDLPDNEIGRKMMIVDACLSYGMYDPDDGSHFTFDEKFPQSSHRMHSNNMIIIQCDPDDNYAPMEYDGWIADVRLSEDQDLFGYLLDNGYLTEFE